MSAAGRAEYIDGLRALATALEEHPEVPLPYEGGSSELHWFLQNDKDAMAATARALPCTFTKNTWDSDTRAYFELTGAIDGLKVQIVAYRDAVCTRRVVGIEEREVEEVVRPAETRKVVKPVEVVEWDCGPLLRPAVNGGPAA